MEAILSTIPGSNDRERMLVVVARREQGTRLILRQQSWGDGVGWYTQKSVEVEPQQLNSLRAALGEASSVARPPRVSAPAGQQDGPQVVRIESA